MNETSEIYITGGFSGNKLFVNLISEAFPGKSVFTSEIGNATALGAALVVAQTKPMLNLGNDQMVIALIQVDRGIQRYNLAPMAALSL